MRYEKSLSEYRKPEEMIFCRGGRTGRKVHRAFKGFSGAMCGKWFKASVNYFAVTPEQADKMERCESCFGGEWLEPKGAQ